MSDPALDALLLTFSRGELMLSPDGRVLFLGARDGFALRERASRGWCCEQSFRPFADALQRSGLHVGDVAVDAQFPLVLLLPSRQRDQRRAQLAQALAHAAADGVVLACVPNVEGAASAEADFRALLGRSGGFSKHKCRVFWSRVEEARIDRQLQADWLALDRPRAIADGYVSRPGLFAWDRVDAASALLASRLPADLAGRAADLGGGYGYLSAQLIARCPGIESLDLFEADARALEPARQNLAQAAQESGRDLATAVHWHDVTTGLPHRYDVIVSNPPFHQGRADLPALGRAFIASAADALHADGRLYLVANRHLPYESVLAERFAQVRTVALEQGFKVFEAIGVRG